MLLVSLSWTAGFDSVVLSPIFHFRGVGQFFNEVLSYGASKFAWSKDGYVYTRMGNPTNSVSRLACRCSRAALAPWLPHLAMPPRLMRLPNAASRARTLSQHHGSTEERYVFSSPPMHPQCPFMKSHGSIELTLC